MSRLEAHPFLVANGWADCDVSRPDVLSKVFQLGLDSMLVTNLSLESDASSLEFVLRDLAGNTLLTYFSTSLLCSSHFLHSIPSGSLPVSKELTTSRVFKSITAR